MKTVQRAYKFRLYPTARQKELLNSYFGTARWAWNWALSVRNQAYRQGGVSLSGVDLSRRLTPYKKTAGYAWLKDTPSTIITQKLRDQDTAFKSFFTGQARYPKFKKRGGHEAIRLQLDQRIVMNNYRAGELLKAPGLGALKIKWSRVPAGIPKMVTIKRTPAGKYYVTFAVEESITALPAANDAVGIDLGLKDLVVTSRGDKSGNPKHLYQSLRKLRHEQRTLARRKRGSNRYARQRQKIARLHERIANQRRDYIHKASYKLISENQAIGIEDLNVRGMQRNRKMAKAIGDAAWGELKRQLIYKAEWHGRKLLECDRWAPSTKSCSDCGFKAKEIPLKIRLWQCPDCGAIHDRDINAAINVLTFATGGKPGDGWAKPTCARGGAKTSGAAINDEHRQSLREARIYRAA